MTSVKKLFKSTKVIYCDYCCGYECDLICDAYECPELSYISSERHRL